MSRELLVKKPVHKLRHNLAATNITTSAYVELEDSMPKAALGMSVMYDGEAILILAIGAAASEVDTSVYLHPGMNGELIIPFEIGNSKRLSAKALDQSATIGDIVINFFG